MKNILYRLWLAIECGSVGCVTVWRQSMRLLLKKWETSALFVTGLAFFCFLLFSFEAAKQEKSVVFIGMVDRDQSVLSQKLLSDIVESEIFDVTLAPLPELLEKQKAGELSAVFVIKEGYEELVKAGQERRLLVLYEPEEDGLPFVSDIVAGKMMYDICTAKGFLQYEKMQTQHTMDSGILSYQEYADYVTEKAEGEEFDFSFHITYRDKVGNAGRVPKQTIIYEQVILAVLSLFISILGIYAVLPYAQLCHGSCAKRVQTLPLSNMVIFAGGFLAAVTLVLAFGIFSVGILLLCNQELSACGTQMFLYTIAYCSGIVMIAMLFALAIRSRAGYQLVLLVLFLFFAAVGFAGVTEGIFLPGGTVWEVPNSIYIKKMADCFANAS